MVSMGWKVKNAAMTLVVEAGLLRPARHGGAGADDVDLRNSDTWAAQVFGYVPRRE